MKMPKTLGACVDLAFSLRNARIEKQREYDAEIAEMKRQEEEIKEHIINSFKKSDINGAKGKTATISIVPVIIPQPKDWPAIYAYIKKNDAFDLMERRLHKGAFKDRLENGEKVPGVEVFEKLDISINKIGEK